MASVTIFALVRESTYRLQSTYIRVNQCEKMSLARTQKSSFWWPKELALNLRKKNLLRGNSLGHTV